MKILIAELNKLRAIAIMTACCCVALASIASAQNPDLFSEVAFESLTQQQKARIEQLQQAETTIRVRAVWVNTEMLRTEGPFVLNMFSDKRVAVQKQKVETRDVNRFTWYGGPADKPGT